MDGSESGLPQRKSIRLKHYDYALAGAYFVTICTADKRCIFGRIVGEEMQLNELGRIVDTCWRQIPEHFQSVELDEFIIMPNHLHGIIILQDNTCRGAACSARETDERRGTACSARVSSRGVARNAREMGERRGAACSTRETRPVTPLMRPRTLSTIIRSFKSAVSKSAREQKQVGSEPLWQRNFFERIIRNDDGLGKAREYIVTNPLRWHLDKENPDRINSK